MQVSNKNAFNKYTICECVHIALQLNLRAYSQPLAKRTFFCLKRFKCFRSDSGVCSQYKNAIDIRIVFPLFMRCVPY